MSDDHARRAEEAEERLRVVRERHARSQITVEAERQGAHDPDDLWRFFSNIQLDADDVVVDAPGLVRQLLRDKPYLRRHGAPRR